jgi:hypothetical protein
MKLNRLNNFQVKKISMAAGRRAAQVSLHYWIMGDRVCRSATFHCRVDRAVLALPASARNLGLPATLPLPVGVR